MIRVAVDGGWQSLIIAGAVRFGWVHGYSLLSYTAEEVADGIQNFLICVEMALAAVLMFVPDDRFPSGTACCRKSRAECYETVERRVLLPVTMHESVCVCVFARWNRNFSTL